MKSILLRRSLAPLLAHPPSRPSPAPSLAQCQSKLFSTTNSRYAKGGFQTLKPRIPAQMSMKNRVKDTMSSASRDMIPNDIGLLPGTFIRPLWKNMPSIFKDPKMRLRMEWTSLKMKFTNFISLMSYCKFINKKLPLRLRERKKHALELHKQMYTAFAKGDTSSLQKLCCQGIYQTFAARISRRPRNSPRLVWTLHSYKKFPFARTLSGAKVISDRAASLPDAKGFGVRQTIVRIQSKQSLITPTSGDEQNLEEMKEKMKDCTEYVVLQRFMINGEDGDWKIWGLAEETTVEDMEQDPMFAAGLTMKDRIDMLTMRMKG